MQRLCEVCGNAFEGRADARYCSATCRSRAHRGETPTETKSRFTIERDAFGAGVHRVLFDGYPLGKHLAERLPDASPDEVGTLLTDLGLEQEHVLDYVRRRTSRDEALVGVSQHPAWQRFLEAERRHDEKMAIYRREFLKAQAKK